MFESIEKLLTLQDRDRRLIKINEELSGIPVERDQLAAQVARAQASHDAAKLKMRHLESERKKLELDVEAKKQLIEKYSLQQFQTKKNEEYRALANEITVCKGAITKLEDQELELMEQSEAAQKLAAASAQHASEAKRTIDSRITDLAHRETTLRGQVADLAASRAALAGEIEDSVRSKYDRLLRSKGPTAVVGIQHGVCGGCHMQLSRHIVVGCQAREDLLHCPNCGRMLYYSAGMDVAVAD